MNEECTHELFEWGICVSCGEEREYEDGEFFAPTSTPKFGCQNRGWYHDGSEDQEAYEQGRSPKPCPHHSGGTQ